MKLARILIAAFFIGGAGSSYAQTDSIYALNSQVAGNTITVKFISTYSIDATSMVMVYVFTSDGKKVAVLYASPKGNGALFSQDAGNYTYQALTNNTISYTMSKSLPSALNNKPLSVKAFLKLRNRKLSNVLSSSK